METLHDCKPRGRRLSAVEAGRQVDTPPACGPFFPPGRLYPGSNPVNHRPHAEKLSTTPSKAVNARFVADYSVERGTDAERPDLSAAPGLQHEPCSSTDRRIAREANYSGP